MALTGNWSNTVALEGQTAVNRTKRINQLKLVVKTSTM